MRAKVLSFVYLSGKGKIVRVEMMYKVDNYNECVIQIVIT